MAITRKRIPRATAGRISCGRFCMRTSLGEREGDREDGADDAAVDGEWSQPVGLEEAQEEADGEPGGDGGAERADQSLASDVITLGSQQVGQLEDTGRADDRGGEQKGEPGRLLVREPCEEAAAHACPGPREPRDQGQGLRGPDAERLTEGESPGDVLVVLDPGLVANRGAATERLGAEQQQAVDEEEEGGGLGGGEERAERML